MYVRDEFRYDVTPSGSVTALLTHLADPAEAAVELREVLHAVDGQHQVRRPALDPRRHEHQTDVRTSRLPWHA
jgi:hypothetical protein